MLDSENLNSNGPELAAVHHALFMQRGPTRVPCSVLSTLVLRANAREALTDDHPMYGICLNLQTTPRIKTTPGRRCGRRAGTSITSFTIRVSTAAGFQAGGAALDRTRRRERAQTARSNQPLDPATKGKHHPADRRSAAGWPTSDRNPDRLRIGAGGRVDRNAAQPVLTVDLRPHELLMHTL